MSDMIVNREIGGVSSWVVVAESKRRVQPRSSAYLVPTPASFGLVHNLCVLETPRNLRGKDKTRRGLGFVD